MTCRELTQRLRRAGIEEAAGEARWLAAHCTGLSDAWLCAHPDSPLPDGEGKLERTVGQREARIPLQYIIGVWPFWRQEYEVSPDCLIPRSDTELLLETALEYLPEGGRFLDLCTGSGCLAVSLCCERPDAVGTAVELVPRTLELARRNAGRNGVSPGRLCFCCGDVLRGEFPGERGPFSVILSNPPYIPTRDLEGLSPEVHREPRIALDGGEDGVTFYRRLLSGADYRAALAEDGCFHFEIGYDQGEAIGTLAEKYGYTCRIRKDLGGNDRVAIVRPLHTL